MNTNTQNITCPTCEAPATWVTTNKFRPFCSERCKLIDLGAWADEQHKISSKSVDPDALFISINDLEDNSKFGD